MYTEQSVIDSIEILEDGRLQVRRSDRVLKNGLVIAQTYHRHVLEPGQDIKAEDSKVAKVAAAVWTRDVIDKFNLAMAPLENG